MIEIVFIAEFDIWQKNITIRDCMERLLGIVHRRKAHNEKRIVDAMTALHEKGVQHATAAEVVAKIKEQHPRKTKLGKLVQIVAFTEPSVRLARKGIITGGWDKGENNPTSANRRYSLTAKEERDESAAA